MSSATSVIRQVVSGSRIRESSLLSSRAFICRIQRGVLPRPHAIEIVVRNNKAFRCAVSRCRKRDVHPYHLDVVMDRSGIPVVWVVLEIAAFWAVTATWHEGRRVVAEATWRVAWLACPDHPNAAIAPTHAAREPGSACPSLLNSRRRSHATSTRSDGILADIRWELAPVRQGHPMRGETGMQLHWKEDGTDVDARTRSVHARCIFNMQRRSRQTSCCHGAQPRIRWSVALGVTQKPIRFGNQELRLNNR